MMRPPPSRPQQIGSNFFRQKRAPNKVTTQNDRIYQQQFQAVAKNLIPPNVGCGTGKPKEVISEKQPNEKSENTDEEKEPEPEWFNVSVSRQDFVDLHGFEGDGDDDESLSKLYSDVKDKEVKNQQTDQNKSDYQRSNNQRADNNSNNYRRSLNQDQSNRFNGQNHRSSQFIQNNYPQRFRNPLHYSKCKVLLNKISY